MTGFLALNLAALSILKDLLDDAQRKIQPGISLRRIRDEVTSVRVTPK